MPGGWVNVRKEKSNDLKTEQIVPSVGPDGSHLAASIPPNGVTTPDIKAITVQDGLQQKMATDSLRSHPLAVKIYGDSDVEDDGLLESVRTQGVLTPLLVIRDGTVIAGRERLRVARALGIDAVPVRMLDLSKPLAIEAAIIESNVAREKTAELRAREYRVLKRIEADKAEARKGARNDLMENFPLGDSGAARDLAAAKVNWSGPTAEKAVKVLHAIEEQTVAEANMQDVEELRTTLNEQSVDAAYQKAVEFGWMEERGRTKARSGSTPERRIAGVYKKATAAVGKVATIFKGEDVANFSPEQNRELKEALMPVLKWVDGLGRA